LGIKKSLTDFLKNARIKKKRGGWSLPGNQDGGAGFTWKIKKTLTKSGFIFFKNPFPISLVRFKYK